MVNNDFLKKLIILYVEDDEVTREQLGKFLKRLFKTVVLASNGEDGYEKYRQITKQGYTIDLILSDINMPKMNGIEMLEKIREFDSGIPFIFTTARSETEYLLKAIELNVDHYALKPLNMEDTILRIQKVCEKKYYEKVVQKQQNELENYFEAISSVALMYRMDDKGQILYANENFLEILKYNEEEAKELFIKDLLPKDIPEEFINQTWEHIRSDNIWKGDSKYIDKEGNIFYLKITIFKIGDEVEEYLTIGFDHTEDYVKKRDFHKNVMINLKDKNIKISELNKKSQNQAYKIDQLADYMREMQKKVDEEKAKTKVKHQQIEFYEKKLSKIDEKYEGIIKKSEKRFDDFMGAYNNMKSKYDTNINKILSLEKELELNRKLVQKREQKINDIKIELDKRESQLRKIDPRLIYK